VLYAVVLTVVAVEPILLAPLATTHRPAPAAIVADGDAIARSLGAAPAPIEIAATSGRSNTLIARASGLGPFDRILLGDTTVARLSPAELRFLLARLYVLLHEHTVLILALVATTLFVLAAAIAVLISDRIGFRRDDDALSRLTLVGAFLGIAVLALYPVFNNIERRVETRADDAALRATRDPAAAIRLMVRRADDDLVALCGRRSARWYFESRPPLGTRIATIRGTQDPCPP
jgi:Zn-dependent protease with chaperone function